MINTLELDALFLFGLLKIDVKIYATSVSTLFIIIIWIRIYIYFFFVGTQHGEPAVGQAVN